MKATDLMMGDWVQIVSDAPTMANEYHRIDWIRTGEIGLDNRKIVTYPFIQPIPLTPEILEKNGFERVANNNPFDIDYILTDEEYFDLTARTIQEGLWQIKYVNLEIGPIPPSRFNVSFVHELQHALRLCGIEKEIEL